MPSMMNRADEEICTISSRISGSSEHSIPHVYLICITLASHVVSGLLKVMGGS